MAFKLHEQVPELFSPGTDWKNRQPMKNVTQTETSEQISSTEY